MGRQRLYTSTPANSHSDHHFQTLAVTDGFPPDEIADTDLPETAADHPVFIARMPNLEEPRPQRVTVALPSVWNRLFEMKNGITDQQQIYTLWCIIALLVCMLFWSMVSKPTPNSPGLTQQETSVDLEDEPYRSLTRNENRVEVTPRESARPVRQWDNEEFAPVLPMSSIDLSGPSEEISPMFGSEQRYAATPSPERNSTPARSAWDREVYSPPSTSDLPAPVAAWNSEPDSTPDFSQFAAPNYGTLQTARNEQEVRQVQYHQAPAMTPDYGEPVPSYSQRNPHFPANTQPGTGPYASAHTPQTPQTPQPSSPYGQQVQSTPSYQQPSYQQVEPDSRYNATHYQEERIPATYSNNTYRNPGTSQTTAPGGYYAAGTNPNTAGQQGLNGQHQPQYHPPQYNQPTNQPTYGTATLPANPWNR